MNDPMRILKADHREAEKLLSSSLIRRKDRNDSSSARSYHEAHRPHGTRGIDRLPAVREAVGQEDEEEAEVEHRLAREGLDKLNSLVDVPGFGAAVEMLKGGIMHHVEEEENELLPELKDRSAARSGRRWAMHIAAAKQARPAGPAAAEAPVVQASDEGQEPLKRAA